MSGFESDINITSRLFNITCSLEIAEDNRVRPDGSARYSRILNGCLIENLASAALGVVVGRDLRLPGRNGKTSRRAIRVRTIYVSTSRIGNLTRLMLSLLKAMMIHD